MTQANRLQRLSTRYYTRKWFIRKYRALKSWTIATAFTYVGQPCLSLLLRTCRIEFRGLDEYLETAKKQRCILTVWHNRLSILIGLMLRAAPQFEYAAVISQSHDGRIIATLVDSFRQAHAIRVSAAAKHQGLRRTIQALRRGTIVVMTPDGPRGPRYQIKPGMVFAARLAKAHVVPLSWVADKYWELKTWDRMMIPKPFSRILVTFGTPIVYNGKEEGPEPGALSSQICKADELLWKEIRET